MSWTDNVFGVTSDGNEIKSYTCSNYGLEISIINYGSTITSLKVPDKQGNIDDITIGFDNIKDYEDGTLYNGAIVGRCANRIANGKFTIDGEEYQLAVNNPPNHIHGGYSGFDKKVWCAEVDGSKLKMTYVSPDGEEKYPGQLTTCVAFELMEDKSLCIDYTATTTRATVVNLTSHPYFNLNGHKSHQIKDHMILINADKFTPVDENTVPTGELASVAGTLFDVRQPTLLEERMDKVPGGIGFDHNYCINGDGDKKFAARVTHESTGRTMEVYTSCPGLQFYTGHYLTGCKGKEGASYPAYSSFCLETQNYPDAVNKRSFPNSVLKPGEVYRETTWYKFGVDA